MTNTRKLPLFQPQEPRELPIISGRKHNRYGAEPLIYSEDELPDLLKKTGVDEDEVVGDIVSKIIRFVVGSDRKLRFASEGAPNKYVPGHGEMLAGCIAAGNMFFTVDGKLIKINNKSGDFRPHFQSVQFALLAMLQANIPFHDSVMIEEQNNGGKPISTYVLTKADLLSELSALPQSAANDAKTSQPTSGMKRIHEDVEGIENVSYSTNQKVARSAVIKRTPASPLPFRGLRGVSVFSSPSSRSFANDNYPSSSEESVEDEAREDLLLLGRKCLFGSPTTASS